MTSEFFNYGVPTGVLIVLLLGIWRLVLWGRAHVLEPIVRSHLELIDTFTEHLPKLAETLENQSKEIGRQTDILEKMNQLMEKVIVNQSDILKKFIQEDKS